MTFEEWVRSKGIERDETTYTTWENMHDAWNAATQAERERCAGIAESFKMVGPSPIGPLHQVGWDKASKHIATTIRKGAPDVKQT